MVLLKFWNAITADWAPGLLALNNILDTGLAECVAAVDYNWQTLRKVEIETDITFKVIETIFIVI